MSRPGARLQSALAREHLARTGERAQAGSHIQGASPVALADRNRFAGVDPDTDAARQFALSDGGLDCEGRLERPSGRVEDDEGLVPP